MTIVYQYRYNKTGTIFAGWHSDGKCFRVGATVCFRVGATVCVRVGATVWQTVAAMTPPITDDYGEISERFLVILELD